MEFKGTKLEWEADLVSNVFPSVYSKDKKYSNRMSVSVHLYDYNDESIGTSMENLANAQLISKSKELLELLTKIRKEENLSETAKKDIDFLIDSTRVDYDYSIGEDLTEMYINEFEIKAETHKVIEKLEDDLNADVREIYGKFKFFDEYVMDCPVDGEGQTIKEWFDVDIERVYNAVRAAQ